MAKGVPTTKSCDQIKNLICPCCTPSMYVQTTFDSTTTHALYGVLSSEVDRYKDKIKSIGGKYIRVVRAGGRDNKIICFRLEATQQEITAKKMREDAEKKRAEALETKKCEVNESIILQNAGATSELGKSRFAGYLLDGSLDPLLPLESYVLLEDPTDKDEKRIYDIVQKANAGFPGCVGMVTTQRCKMIQLAEQMNKAITGEDKRLRRKAACLKYGLKFLASCFEKPAA